MPMLPPRPNPPILTPPPTAEELAVAAIAAALLNKTYNRLINGKMVPMEIRTGASAITIAHDLIRKARNQPPKEMGYAQGVELRKRGA